MNRVFPIMASSAVVLAAAIALMAISHGVDVARGWLSAFVLVSMIPIGSLTLLLVHAISGGRWGAELAPALAPAARCIPLLFVAFMPILIFRSSIYDWHAIELEPDVLRYYLNPGFFDARTLIALTIWSALAWAPAWRTPLFAALGLVIHLILMTFVPADWVLTIPPASTSAGFGLGWGIEQILAAAAFAAILAPTPAPRPNRDLAAIIVASLLGTVYFIYMQFIIIWYGNVPERVKWYVARAAHGWPAVALAAFMIGAALPFLATLSPHVRREASGLRVVGILIIAGIGLHVAWLTTPAFGATALVPAAAAVVLMALGLALFWRVPAIRSEAHGR